MASANDLGQLVKAALKGDKLSHKVLADSLGPNGDEEVRVYAVKYFFHLKSMNGNCETPRFILKDFNKFALFEVITSVIESNDADYVDDIREVIRDHSSWQILAVSSLLLFQHDCDSDAFGRRISELKTQLDAEIVETHVPNVPDLSFVSLERCKELLSCLDSIYRGVGDVADFSVYKAEDAFLRYKKQLTSG